MRTLENIGPYNTLPMFDHPYVYTSGSRVTLFADETRWAIVFEKAGYGEGATIETTTFGNCLVNQSKQGSDGQFLSNTSFFSLVPIKEFEKIQYGPKSEMSGLVSPLAKSILVRNCLLPIEHGKESYRKRGIRFRNFDNAKGLIDFPALIRYLNDENPEVFYAREEELKSLLPSDLPKLFVINEWHHKPYFELQEWLGGTDVKSVFHGDKPSSYETYPMMAEIIVTKDTTRWKPTLKPNTNWRNWPGAGSM
ncbi:MAG: hypothetical protein EOP04_10015 [Proteobacteria bacterium]|nr:MAG: hypothetical protein EOP04_10015 [Pseudomonadota bacterium]